MQFYSTNHKIKNIRLPQVFLQGLAPDSGLFLPDRWPKLPKKFIDHLNQASFHAIAQTVAGEFIKKISRENLRKIIQEAFNFFVPLRRLHNQTYILELFHGSTCAFKDFGARFLSRTMGYFLRAARQTLNIIVATSGDTGSAVASGFFKVPNTRVFILYPSGKVSPLQEKQLTTFGANIIALEVKGAFDDCQRLAKQVLADTDLNARMQFSSANSINFGRLLPQSFYYFWAVGQLRKLGEHQKPVFVVPSGNFGNLFAGLMAKKMGLPVLKFIAACNSNDVVPKYLKTGKFLPKKSKKTISNAMDVGNPSNFARMLEIYHHNYREMSKDVAAFSISDAETRQTIKKVYQQTGYICDPHTAVGITAAERYQKMDKSKFPIVVLSTAHPAKFKEIVEPVIRCKLALPRQLQSAMRKKKQAIKVSKNYPDIKRVLLGLAQDV